MTYKRNCPKCGDEIGYTNKRSWYNAKRNKSKCKECARLSTQKTIQDQIKNGTFNYLPRDKDREKTLERNFHKNCPKCGEVMSYSLKRTLKSAIKGNTMCNRCSTIKHKKGVSFRGATEEEIKQMRATKAGFDNWDDYVEKYPEKEFYKREVWKHTYRNDLESLENWERRGRCGVDGAYQLDHIISINEGWENNIPPDEIADIENLRMIPWKENRTKGG